ncbi:DUF6572 domain-containing protein [Rhizobium leguminosarum]|uniref:DUF6572 domain-containing protein n=1 Tax=Rhizobium leguminosarum TaxID=384 RepID=UPI0021BBCDE6|nr:DUF6572 domain-containing protein [Rhizobium leguminosarum]
MSLDQTNVVDAIGVDDATGELVLTITDHLEWTGSDKEHLLLLQEKLNTYLGFVESGEMLETYPDAKGRAVLIDVVCKYLPSQHAQRLLQQSCTNRRRCRNKTPASIVSRRLVFGDEASKDRVVEHRIRQEPRQLHPLAFIGNPVKAKVHYVRFRAGRRQLRPDRASAFAFAMSRSAFANTSGV